MVGIAALKHNVPAALVRSIMAVESNFDPNVVSRRGAIGLMQLMPDMAKEYGIDPNVPAQNVDGGTHHLRVLMNRYSKSGDSLRPGDRRIQRGATRCGPLSRRTAVPGDKNLRGARP